mmetsp:Transcript_27168/g.24047  ORF Transcript_27168/g.24047 Transcript_27168/m.24047 type:complete len:238 (+) Transcript_27168:1215-1928(+)
MPIHSRHPETGIVRVIPVIFGVGNHDLGVVSSQNINIPHDSIQPAFKHYFPQNLVNDSIPLLKDRKSYFKHKFGDDLLLISLDTGYEKYLDTEQVEFMKNALEESDYKVKIAQYHSPIYPSCFPNRDMVVQELGKKHWAPLFEEYNFTLVSENHNHGFKRTKRIKNGKADKKGVTYIGEGSWGVVRDYCIVANIELMGKRAQKHVVWEVNLGEFEEIVVKAYDQEFKVIDEFSRKIE